MIRSKFRVICIWSLLCVPAFCPGESTTAPLFQSSSTESITVLRDPISRAGLTRQVSVNYHQILYTMPGERDLIARETITSGYSEAAEGESADATVDLYYRRPDFSYPAKPDHSTTVSEASKIHFGTDYWSAKITACCDGESILQLFAYGQNRPFLYSNRKYAQINLPNAQLNRYVGIVLRSQVPMDDLDSAIFGSDNKAIAAVIYASPEKPLQKLLLYKATGKTEDDLPYHTDTVTAKSDSPKDEDSTTDDLNVSKVLLMWSQDSLPGQPLPVSISGFSIIASLAGNSGKPETVTIPVTNDKFGKPQISGSNLALAME